MTYEAQFAALGHPLRQQIIERLGQAPASVRELTDDIAASQPVVSQHLKVLRDAGLVTSSPSGTKSIHQIAPEQLDLLRQHLERHWRNALNALEDHINDD